MSNIKDQGLSVAYGAGAGLLSAAFMTVAIAGGGAALQTLVFNGYGPRELIVEGLGIVTFIGGALGSGHVAASVLKGKAVFEHIRADFKESTALIALDVALAAGIGIMLYNTDNVMGAINRHVVHWGNVDVQAGQMSLPAKIPAHAKVSFGDYEPPFTPAFG